MGHDIEMISIVRGSHRDDVDGRGKDGCAPTSSKVQRRNMATSEALNAHVPEVEGNMERRWVAVDYPGPVKDVRRALETLGGEEEVLTAAREALEDERNRASTSGRTLELRLNKDADRALLTGRIARSNGMVLKVDWKENRVVQGAELVARLENTYVFDGMADFQYQLPSNSRKTAEYVMNGNDVTIESMIGETGNEELQLLPPFFAKVDQPLEYNFKEYYAPEHARVYPKEAGKVFKSTVQTVDYRVNEVPAALEERSFPKDLPEELVEIIKNMFQERPVWSIGNITERLKDFPAGSLRKALAYHCYRFANGPWGKLWVRNGYDPRLDQRAGLYQALYYRLPLKWYRNESKELQQGSIPGPADAQEGAVGPSLADVCSFKALPLRRGIFVQLNDLIDGEIQEILEGHLRREDLHCEESNGWFDRETMDRIRSVMYRRFCELKGIAVAPSPVAEGSPRPLPMESVPADAALLPGALSSAQDAEEEEEYALLDEDSDLSSMEDDGQGSVSDGYPMDVASDEDRHFLDPSEDGLA